MFIGATRGMTIHAPRSPLTLMGHDGTSDNVLAVPTLDLSLLGDVLPAGVTFTRSTTGTYFNTSGVLTTAAIDAPRFDCDPQTGARRGLLMEGSRTNLLLRSEEFDNAAWVKGNATVVANTATAPDNTATGDRVTADATATTHFVSQSYAKAASALDFAGSIFLRADALSRALVRIGSANGLASVLVNISGQVNVTVATSGTAPYTNASASIVSLLNGWVRVTIRATTNTDTSVALQVFLDNGTGAAAASTSFTGDGTSGIYVWGAQLEQAAFESSYIKTTTATVTRAYDNCIATVSGINSPALTMLFEGIVASAQSPSYRYCADLGDGTVTNDVTLYVAANSLYPRGLTRVANVANGNPGNGAAITVGSVFRSAYSTRDDNHITAAAGVSTSDLTGATSTATLTTLGIGGRNDSSPQDKLFGYCRRVVIWNVAFSATNLLYLVA